MNSDNSETLDRRTILKLTGGVGIAGLAGCLNGGGGSGGGQGNTLEVLHGWTGGDGKEAIQALTSGFESKHSDVKTDFRPIGGGGNENLDSVVAQRLGNNDPPSSFAGWPGANLTKYKDVLGDASSAWKDGGLEGAHVQEAQEACKFDGKYAAVPIGSHRMNEIFYNASVVEEAGVDPSSITDMDALFGAMDRVSENTDAVPMAHAMQAPWTTLQLFAVVLQGQEGYQAYMDFIEGNGNEGAVRRTFETMKEILGNYINDDAASIEFTTANNRIMSGEAAFIHQGNWVAGSYKGNDLAYEKDWGSFPFPGTDGMYGLHIDSFIKPTNNPTPDETTTWLQYVGSKQAQIDFNNLKGSIPTRNDIKTDEFDQYLTDTIEDFQNAQQKPPTLAHGLAVSPDVQSDLEGVITNNFSGPYNVDGATQGMLETVK